MLNPGGEKLATAKLEQVVRLDERTVRGYCFHRDPVARGDWMVCENCGSYWFANVVRTPLPIIRREPQRCPRCKGTGMAPTVGLRHVPDGELMTCLRCEGRGTLAPSPPKPP